MGKNKESVPQAPEYQVDHESRKVYTDFTEGARDWMNLDLENNPMLLETLQFNPQMLETFKNTLEQQLAPSYEKSKQNLINEVVNMGGETASTLPNKLGELDESFLNTLQVQSGQFGLDTMLQAMQNRINVAGQGLSNMNAGAQLGQSRENSLNNFNLANYENQLAEWELNRQQNSGWLGALTGGIGGALTGGSMGGFGGALAGGLGGGALGYFGGSSMGSGILNMGVGSMASGGIKGLSGGVDTRTDTNVVRNPAGKTASDDMFNRLMRDYQPNMGRY